MSKATHSKGTVKPELIPSKKEVAAKAPAPKKEAAPKKVIPAKVDDLEQHIIAVAGGLRGALSGKELETAFKIAHTNLIRDINNNVIATTLSEKEINALSSKHFVK